MSLHGEIIWLKLGNQQGYFLSMRFISHIWKALNDWTDMALESGKQKKKPKLSRVKIQSTPLRKKVTFCSRMYHVILQAFPKKGKTWKTIPTWKYVGLVVGIKELWLSWGSQMPRHWTTSQLGDCSKEGTSIVNNNPPNNNPPQQPRDTCWGY